MVNSFPGKCHKVDRRKRISRQGDGCFSIVDLPGKQKKKKRVTISLEDVADEFGRRIGWQLQKFFKEDAGRLIHL